MPKISLTAEERQRGIVSATRCWLCGKETEGLESRMITQTALTHADGMVVSFICTDHREVVEKYYQGWLQTLRGRLIQEIKKGGDQ